VKKIIAGEAVMSYRFDCYRLYRIWAIILRDIREVRFIPWITREREMETGRKFVLLSPSLTCRTSYLLDWKPPSFLIPNKSVRRQPGTVRPPFIVLARKGRASVCQEMNVETFKLTFILGI